MKNQVIDEVMAEVHAIKDALSREAGYDVTRLLEAARRRAGRASSSLPPGPAKPKEKAKFAAPLGQAQRLPDRGRRAKRKVRVLA